MSGGDRLMCFLVAFLGGLSVLALLGSVTPLQVLLMTFAAAAGVLVGEVVA